MTNTISFPGLDIGEFQLNTIAFTIFGREIAWYGIIITLGIILGFTYVMYRAKFENVKTDDVLDYAIYCVIFAMIGARAYYVLASLDDYNSFYEAIAIWEGGVAIYGAVIGGALAAYIVSKLKKLKVLKIFDMLSPAVMLGQIIGRWGNFINAEAYGAETDVPWRMGIRFQNFASTIYVHPTFLYESLWNLVGFIIINIVYKKKKFDGQIFLMYMSWYGLGRAYIEGLRADSLYVGNYRISQLLAAFTFVLGTVLLVVLYNNARKNTVNIEGVAALPAEEKPPKESGNTKDMTDKITEMEENEGDENGENN